MAGATSIAELLRRTTGVSLRPPRAHASSDRRPSAPQQLGELGAPSLTPAAARAARITAAVCELERIVAHPTSTPTSSQAKANPHGAIQTDTAAHAQGLSMAQWEILSLFASQWQRLSTELATKGLSQGQLENVALPMLDKLDIKLATAHVSALG